MNYKISELQSRYGVASKQSVYDRMKALHIKPVSRGKVSSDSLDKLDKLDEFMKSNPGSAMWEFPKDAETLSSGQLDTSSGQLDTSSGQLDTSSGQLNDFSEMLQLVKAIARHFSNQDPLAKYKALEYAANHIIFLPTSKIAELTGANPSKIHFQRGTFIFTKVSEIKIGRESAWRVQMPANPSKH